LINTYSFLQENTLGKTPLMKERFIRLPANIQSGSKPFVEVNKTIYASQVSYAS
jgi:hypothetical protein